MTVAEVLALAQARGVTIRLDGAELELSADRKPNSDLLDAIAGRKADIVAFLHPDAVRRRLEAEAGVLRAPRPPDVTDVAWKTAIDGLRAFIAGGYGAEAERCGWTKAELYRVPELWSQIHLTGAGLLIGDREVVGITPNEIRTQSLVGRVAGLLPQARGRLRRRLPCAHQAARRSTASKEEFQLRALEATVNLYRSHHPNADVDTAKAAVLAAIKEAAP